MNNSKGHHMLSDVQLIDCTLQITAAVTTGQPKTVVAELVALAKLSTDDTDWRAVYAAIQHRWGAAMIGTILSMARRINTCHVS